MHDGSRIQAEPKPKSRFYKYLYIFHVSKPTRFGFIGYIIWIVQIVIIDFIEYTVLNPRLIPSYHSPRGPDPPRRDPNKYLAYDKS